VTDLERSVRFYQEILGLKVVRTGDFARNGGGKYVPLRDPTSGQRLELNWYPESSKYATRYAPGEGLDHLGVKVVSVAEKLREFQAKGLEVVPIPDSLARQVLSESFTIHTGFVKDPDGNWIGLYDHPGGIATYDPRGTRLSLDSPPGQRILHRVLKKRSISAKIDQVLGLGGAAQDNGLWRWEGRDSHRG
jgi:catechol 2,3-dioxygenase-like lactoylglutathione lyase family enzyme